MDAGVKSSPPSLWREFIYGSIALESKACLTAPHSHLVDYLTITGSCFFIFWLLAAGLSVMAFDSGVTTEAWTFVIAVWSYPDLADTFSPLQHGLLMLARRTGWQAFSLHLLSSRVGPDLVIVLSNF